MIVVSDTGPLQYLVLIDEIDVLRTLHGECFVPPAVLSELMHGAAPAKVREWIEHSPEWVKVVKPLALLAFPPDLGRGETEAISLAVEMGATLLLDDQAARKFIEPRIRCVGTLGILISALRNGLLNINNAVQKLSETNFRSTAELYRLTIETAEHQITRSYCVSGRPCNFTFRVLPSRFRTTSQVFPVSRSKAFS